ncbi:MAG: hypothetical protein ACOYJC_09230 [Christensenellales bacterium]|jgi:hypothetical protein
MNIKRIIRTICFLLILCLVFVGLNDVLAMNPVINAAGIKRINSLYAQPKDSLDVLLFGASGVYRAWNSMQAWEELGITSYAWCTGSQSVASTRYLIEDTLKHQTPKVILIDYRMFRKEPEEITSGAIRRVSDLMPFSRTRIDAINAMLDAAPAVETQFNRWEYYISFMQYHSRWEDGLIPSDFTEKLDPLHGTPISQLSFNISPQAPASSPTEEIEPIDEIYQDVLSDLCEYVLQLDIPVLFTMMPYNPPLKERKQLNWVESVLDFYGLPYMNMNDPEYFDAYGLDFSEDFYDKGHVNLKGMQKVTARFGAYLKDAYGLADHRGDAYYAHWDEALPVYHKRLDRYEWKKKS